MAIADIPRPIWDFIESNIDSVPQLEALLLIYGAEERAWTAEEIATRTYVAIEAARDILEALKRRMLLQTDDEPMYRRVRVIDDKVMMIPAVADAYRRHLVLIATFIHSRASVSVREFARAFEIKKDH